MRALSATTIVLLRLSRNLGVSCRCSRTNFLAVMRPEIRVSAGRIVLPARHIWIEVA